MNKYIKRDDYYEIHIYGNKHEGVVFIDKEDYDLCKKHSWCINENKSIKYVASKIEGKTVRLDKLIMCITSKKTNIEHINRNPYNNRRKNLRIVE